MNLYKPPSKKKAQGGTLHYEHVPATVSICSNVPGHTDPVHLHSNSDPQDLIDQFVGKVMEIQKSKEELLTGKYQPYIEAFAEQCLEVEARLRGGLASDDLKSSDDNVSDLEVDDDDDEGKEFFETIKARDDGNKVQQQQRVAVMEVGKKRKRKGRVEDKRSRKRAFFMDGEAAELDGDDSSGDDDDDANDSDDGDTSDIEGLIDNISDVEDDNASFYRTVDNNTDDVEPSRPSTTMSQPSSSCSTTTDTA